MSVEITKHPDGYTAIVHLRWGVAWSWSTPIEEEPLRIALHAVGCHPIDVTEAFAAADPVLMKRLHEAAERVRIGEIDAETKERAAKGAEEAFRRQRLPPSELADEDKAWRHSQKAYLEEHFGKEEAARIIDVGDRSNDMWHES